MKRIGLTVPVTGTFLAAVSWFHPPIRSCIKYWIATKFYLYERD